MLDPSFPITSPRRIVVNWVSEETIKKLASNLGRIELADLPNLFKYIENKEEAIISFPRISSRKTNPFLPIEEDLKQNLLTVNAIAFNLNNAKFIDPYKGLQHIKDKQAVIVNDQVFFQDSEIVLETLLQIVLLDLSLPTKTKQNFLRVRDSLNDLPDVIIGEHLRKAMKLPSLKKYFKLLDELGYTAILMPHLNEAKQITQTKKNGVSNVQDHCILSANSVHPNNALIRWAALYHDLGKATTKKVIDGKTRFFGHERVSAKWAYKDLVDWGFPRDFARNVAHLVVHHMFDGGPQLTDEAVRRLIRRVGHKHIYDLLDLRLADSAGFIGKPTGVWKVNKLRKRVDNELRKNPFSVAGLNISRATVKKLIKEDDNKVANLLLEIMLDSVLFQGLKNDEQSLAQWVMSLNIKAIKEFCPLGIQWLLEQYISRIERRAEENSDGTLKCGKHCKYKCDSQEKDFWKL